MEAKFNNMRDQRDLVRKEVTRLRAQSDSRESMYQDLVREIKGFESVAKGLAVEVAKLAELESLVAELQLTKANL